MVLVLGTAGAFAEDASAPTSKEALYIRQLDGAAEVLAGLQKLVEDGQWADAVAEAQKHIESGSRHVAPGDNGTHVSFAERIRQIVCGWPDEGIRSYRERYEKHTAQLLAPALAARNARALAALADRYRATEAGAEALGALAEIHLQRGALVEADIALTRLLTIPKPPPMNKAELRRKLDAVRSALARWRDDSGRPAYRLGHRAWSFDVPEADLDQAMVDGLSERGQRIPRPIHPVPDGPRVLFQTSQYVTALNRATGALVWRYPQQPEAPDGGHLFDAVMAPVVGDGRVSAVVAGRVVSLSSSNGELLWEFDKLLPEIVAPVENEGAPAPPSGFVLVNSLAEGDGKLFIAMATVKQETEFSVVALSARSGAELWRTPLCSQVFSGVLGRGSHPAPPVVHRGVVYVSTNLGAVAALDASNGAIRWLTTYNAFSPERRRVALRDDACWANNRPVVYRGKLLVAAQDSDHLIGLDLRDGSLLWAAPRLGGRYLFGADGGMIRAAGSKLVTVDVETGRVMSALPMPDETVARPVMSDANLWLPTERNLVAIDRKTGLPVMRYRVDRPGESGNLVLADGLLLLASPYQLHAFRELSSARQAGAAGMFAAAEWMDRTGDTARALREYKLALYALDAEPQAERGLHPRVLAAIAKTQVRLGEALVAAGKFEEAVRALSLARNYASKPADAARITCSIAECHEHLKNWEAAVHAWQSLLEHYGDAPVTIREGVALPGRHVARFRIDRILAAEGRDAYRLFDGRAQQKLALARENREPEALQAMLDRYPNSKHADAARKELAMMKAGREPFTRVWFTAYDSSRSTPVVLAEASEGTPLVFIATRDGGNHNGLLWDAVEGRRLRDGQILWRTQVDNMMAEAVRDQHVLVLRGYTHLVALDTRSGERLWKTEDVLAKVPEGVARMGWTADLHRITDLTVGGGRAFVTVASKRLLAFNLEDGKELWSKTLDGNAQPGSLRIAGRRVVVCIEAPAKALWFDAATGEAAEPHVFKRADNRLTDRPAYQPENARLGVVVGDRQVRNLDLNTGKELWAVEMPFSVGRVATLPDESRLVVFPDRWSFGGKVQCLDATTGKTLWAEPPKAQDPETVFVRNDLVISSRREMFTDTVTAQKTADGSVLWERSLRARPSIDRVLGAGPRLAAFGSNIEQGQWIGEVQLLRAADGQALGSLRRPGAGLASVAELGETLILGSSRGVEAWRDQDTWAGAEPLLRLLDTKDLPGVDEPGFAELVRLLMVHEQYQPAMALLNAALEAEPPKPEHFVTRHRQLAAAREADALKHRTVYEAPRLRRPPTIDGRLTEDWRRDRAAVLNRPHHIEAIQSAGPLQRFWNGRNDLSAVLYIGWDEENLYFAVDVNDFVHRVHDFDADVWNGDCLVVGIDPEGDGGYRMRGLDNVFWLGLAAKQQRDPEEDRERLGGKHGIKIKEDESGVVYELSLPWSELGINRPRPGMRFRFNVMAIDEDAGGPLKAVSWTPGLTQNIKRRGMVLGIAPELFGTVILKER